MINYKVSIIVGIYNSSEFLRKGLDSIRNQTWQNIEVILMDDGSTDNSGLICDEYSSMDERFITIHKKNTGVCDSRNQGLKIATGDYVCFMDGDDWFSDDFVEYMMSLIIKTKTQMAFSDQLFTTRDRVQSQDDKVEVWDAEKAISLIIYPHMILGPWNKIYSMDVIREHKITFPAHWFGETLHFASNVAYYACKVAVGHRKVYNYRLNNQNSGTTQYNVKYRLLSLDNCTRLRNAVFYTMPEVKNAVEWHIYTNYYSLIENIIGSGKRYEYKSEYNYARKYLLSNCIIVFLHSHVSLKHKARIIIEALCPNALARRSIRKHICGLRNDGPPQKSVDG